MNQHVQDRLREEINANIRKYGDVTYEGVKEMSYLEMVFCGKFDQYMLLWSFGHFIDNKLLFYSTNDTEHVAK